MNEKFATQSDDANTRCRHCKELINVTLFPVINPDLTPALRERVLSGELFTYYCHKCNAPLFIPFDFKYHDTSLGFTLDFSFDEPDEKTRYLSTEFETPYEDEGEYIYRKVYTYADLIEKIKIFEKRLNDVAVERMKFIMKYVIDTELFLKRFHIYFQNIVYDDNDNHEEKLYFIYDDDDAKETIRLTVSRRLYEGSLLAVQKDERMQLNGNTCVDENWVAKRLLSFQNQSPGKHKGKATTSKCKDGLWALTGPRGKLYTPYCYKKVMPFANNYFYVEVKEGDKYNVVHASGIEIFSEPFDFISEPNKFSFVVGNIMYNPQTGKKEMRYGLAHVTGMVFMPPLLNKLVWDNVGESQHYFGNDGQNTFLFTRRKGLCTIPI